ncbi:hypothetical protein HJFPF1_00305 [Paramyrothecium foliicola]|nr:hypothetical protein HJFPF1_00305 [Paramyrothecium foliicola]
MPKYEGKQQASEMETFHRFGDLPKEIRDEIWILALRDERLGVHFFKMISEVLPVPDGQECLFYGVGHSRARFRSLFNFYVPTQSSTREEEPHTSYFARKVPTHLVDSGLWTACRESRDHITKRHTKRQQKLGHKYSPPMHTRCHGRLNGYFMAGDERQYISVLEHDLVVFQPEDFGTMELRFNLPLIAQHAKGDHALKHAAVELDPTWRPPSIHVFGEAQHGYEKNVTQALLRAKMTSCIPNFWFIDYRIKRSTKVSNNFPRSNHDTFRGNGGRSVEVRRHDDEWELERGEPIFQADSGAGPEERCPSALHFIRFPELRVQVMDLPYMDDICQSRESEAWAEGFWEEEFEMEMAEENYEDFERKSTGPRAWDCDSDFWRTSWVNTVKLGVLAYEAITA